MSSSAPRVLVFGEILWDLFPDGPVPGGAPFNVAAHLQRFGVPVAFVSRVGNDERGRLAREIIRATGLDDRWVQTDPVQPTGSVTVEMKGTGHAFTIGPDQAWDHILPPDDDLTGCEILYFGTLARRLSAESRKTLNGLASILPATRFTDLNLRAPWFDRDLIESSLDLARAAKLNDSELDTLCGLFEVRATDAGERMIRLRERFSLDLLVVTYGEEGAMICPAHKPPERVRGEAVPHLVDTVGAGDAFSAVTLLGLLHGWPPRLLAERADTFARKICGIRGAVPPDDRLHRDFLATL